MFCNCQMCAAHLGSQSRQVINFLRFNVQNLLASKGSHKEQKKMKVTKPKLPTRNCLRRWMVASCVAGNPNNPSNERIYGSRSWHTFESHHVLLSALSLQLKYAQKVCLFWTELTHLFTHKNVFL